MSNEMPEQPKTVELPAMTDRALLEDLTRSVKEGFVKLSGDIQCVATDVTIVKDRVRVVEDRVRSIEDDRRNDSMPAKVVRVTDNDAKQDAAISTLVVDMAAVKADVTEIKSAQTANRVATAETLATIQKDVKGFFSKNPALGLALVGLVTALATGGAACVKERFPQPAVQQVAK